MVRDPTSAAGIGQFAAVRSVAQSLNVELTPLNVRDTDEMERNVAAFAGSGNGGMIVTAGGSGARRGAYNQSCSSPQTAVRLSLSLLRRRRWPAHVRT